jgi:hypothetical protein
LDWNKPLVTSEGETARLLGEYKDGDKVIQAVVVTPASGVECLMTFHMDGTYRFDKTYRLSNVRVKKTGYVAVYPSGSYAAKATTSTLVQASKEAWVSMYGNQPKAICGEITWEE